LVGILPALKLAGLIYGFVGGSTAGKSPPINLENDRFFAPQKMPGKILQLYVSSLTQVTCAINNLT
jgi:hypothetical protein